ncbi:carbohydrate ABC transporter permease [Desmospora profundinema]|uniref:Raffinose/stachyose/melibiose transport system permease protein n=1 Tax=Desmospora profundinema TaxID=1571184 RepID=A0ABU1IMS4_9BACL|nr:carbohydrate ABC transporter permease [Desmospora profundinema]MDR6225085.1 raffinose/stachyose/melibiose transport system permease protein [Desmospora profundinema]
MQKNRTNWLVTILLLLGSSVILFPLYLTVTIAFKTPQELADSLLALPQSWRFENFTDAIYLTGFFNALTNSAVITVSVVVFTLLTNSMVAYAIARNMHRKFFKFLFYYFVSAMFIPFPIIMLPIVKQTSAWGMDNILGLILLYIVYGLAFNVFLYVGYIKSIPKELEEAAIVDGASTWSVFWKVIFPLLTPMNATVGILTALWAWNDFMLPLVIISDTDMATLPLVQYIFQGQFSTNYNLAFASYLMALAPMILVYIVAQKWIISGVTKGAIKS